jgi:uncharacterized protein (TIGR03437 family)
MRIGLVLAVVLAAGPLEAQPLVVTTVAGGSYLFRGDGGPATAAQLSQIYHVIADAQGAALVADRTNHQVVRISPAGILTVIAGNGIDGFSGDGGPATRASLSFPAALALDAAGNLYIADGGNYRIRRVSPGGIMETYAGDGVQRVQGDGGPALRASFDTPRGLAVDAAGNLYVADSAAHRVRRISAAGIITNFAGSTPGFGGDNGPALQARLNEPWHLSMDPRGNLLIGDTRNHRVRSVNPQGIITTVAGRGEAISDGDGGPALQAGIVGPPCAYADAAGNLYVCDFFNKVRIVSPNGMIRTFAGTDDRGFAGDGGPATLARLNVPVAVAGDAAGNIFIADSINLRLRRVDRGGIITTVGGNGQFRFSGDGGPALAASFAAPFGLAADLAGNIYIADSENHRVRRIGQDGRISTVAGTGVAGFSGDGGPGTAAALNYPLGLAIDLPGNLYIADSLNQRVRRLAPNGIIGTVAGGGNLVGPPDGSLATSLVLAPTAVALDAFGSLYILDSALCAVVRVGLDGRASRFAGRYVDCGSTGDGGPARDARINVGATPGGIAVDLAGNVFVAEQRPPPGSPQGAGGRVRVITPAGIIRTFAGNGTQGMPLDGVLAVNAPLIAPESVTTDPFGNVFIGDVAFVYAVVQGQIIRLAGDLSATNSGDGGPSRNASLLGPAGLAFDADGNFLFLDAANYRLRAVLVRPPAAAAAPAGLRFDGSSGGAPAPAQSVAVAASIPRSPFLIQTASQGGWLSVSGVVGETPRLLDVTADPANLAPGTHNGTITITTPFAVPIQRTVAVTFQVGPAAPPSLALDKDNFSFSFPRQAAPRTRALIVSNTGGGPLDFTVSVTINNGGAWLRVAPASGRALPGRPVSVEVTADPTGLAADTYTAVIAVRGAGDEKLVPVTITVSDNDRAILLSQSGLSFTAVSAGGVAPPRTFEVLNIGRGVVNWTASASTLAGGSWLSVSPTAGATDAASSTVPTVVVRVNQAGLAPGVYYGLVTVDAPTAANSPQVVTIFLEVLAPGSDPGPVVEPAELVFTAAAGSSPGSQDVFVYNIAQAAKTYRSSSVLTGANLVSLPGDAVVDPARPNRVIVQPFVAALAPGVHRGFLNLQFSDGRVRSVRVQVILTAPVGAGGGASNHCAPTRLIAAVTSIAPSATVTAGWPVPIDAQVLDDCGDPHESGAVVVSFSNGDAPLVLQSTRNGRWSGTWPSRRGAAGTETTLRVEAVNPLRQLRGEESLVVGIRAQQEAPSVETAGVVSAAGNQSFVPLTPGGMITIYGERLSETTAEASFPLPTQIGSTRLVMGGRPLPLLFVSPGQINAIVPAGLAVNTRHQLLVQRANTYSRPVGLDVGSTQPAIFVVSGSQGHIYRARPGETVLADSRNPAVAGDVLIIYAAGLGAVNPPVADGAAAPSSPLSTLPETPRVTIGGVEARVEFAGLAPGFAALFQLNVVVPAGVGPGDAVGVQVTAGGQRSPVAAMAIR